jgi:Na+/melibiose symporter-like transporter
MFHKLPTIAQILILYVLSAILAFLANYTIRISESVSYTLDFLWLAYLPISTAACILTFDMLLEIVDFDEMESLKEENRVVYVLALCVLSAGFAIATSIFLKSV